MAEDEQARSEADRSQEPDDCQDPDLGADGRIHRSSLTRSMVR
jgi:hypothetical protein